MLFLYIDNGLGVLAASDLDPGVGGLLDREGRAGGGLQWGCNGEGGRQVAV
jgi:hypothetical protein